MLVKELMTPHAQSVQRTTTLADAAKMMRQNDCGALPITNDEQPIGVITDRDIVVRALAEGRDPATTTVGDIMTENLVCCTDDETAEEAARKMSDQQIRRLPVIDRDKRLVGMVALGDLATRGPKEEAGETLTQVSRQA